MANVKKGLLGKLNFGATPEGQEFTAEVVGTLAEVLAEGVDSVKMSTKTPGIILFVGDDSTFIGFSKALGAEVKSGAITTAQLGHCSVIIGQNEQGEERMYLTLPQSYAGRIDATEFLGAINKVSAPTKVVDLGLAALAKDLIK